MKHYLDCYPCFLRQTLEAARMATTAEAVQRHLLREVAGVLAGLRPGATPIEMGLRIHEIIRERTGVADPYRKVKEQSNRHALSLYPRMKQRVEGSPDPLLTAVTLSAIGNVMDFGANPAFDLEQSLVEGLARGLRGDGFREFTRRLGEVARVLLIGDNAGEIVFDRLLVERMSAQGVEVTFVVREAPILNDATLDDARQTEMDQVAEVISSGVVGPGTLLAHCSSGFLDVFKRAELILAKGQGNYEGLSGETGPVFFLLMAKCAVVARDLGVEVGDLVLRAPA